MNWKGIIVIIVVLLLLVGSLFLAYKQGIATACRNSGAVGLYRGACVFGNNNSVYVLDLCKRPVKQYLPPENFINGSIIIK